MRVVEIDTTLTTPLIIMCDRTELRWLNVTLVDQREIEKIFLVEEIKDRRFATFQRRGKLQFLLKKRIQRKKQRHIP
jgi:hypothetical protein